MSKFTNKTLGYRLHLTVTQYVDDIEGDTLRPWGYMSDAERAAWESEAIGLLVEGIPDHDLIDAAAKVLEID